MRAGSSRIGRYCTAFALSALCLSVPTHPVFALDRKEYKILIAFDTLLPFSEGIMDGFRTTMDSQLAESGATAVYQAYDTKLDPAAIPAIMEAIYATKPDLICTVNYPTVFADNMITKKLGGSDFKIVSSNPIPVQSGVISDWLKPGGNVTGVGVFLKFNPQIRLMKMINPKVRKMAFVSWDAVGPLNEWFELEVRRACEEEGIEFVEFRRVGSAEEEVAFYEEYDKKSNEYFIMGGISAWVHEDGTPADMVKIFSDSMKTLKHLQYLSYDENPIKYGSLAGACVVWYDIGAQLAEKGFKILNGTKPGDLSWEYPRKYNIMLNQASAKNKGIFFPQILTGAAYRVYTDYDGNFLGQKN
ncbi:MAG: hypothetical protein A2Z99_15155 [Treponema sp. GWB1_62_6]|nr:MAG: hypothetical protein A2Z99_15155 [Treponema sp. GWB1_62_6]OHE68632.1 MAG: hypothetical protein A2001_05875 [Treponema sp. GWC1_61_84]OHE70385.1 MAG: hypothetical protein A2413_15275 [Treponema sp. RIFOXYC1_FULL_61_9]HCM26583.1 hypothetical protein [Treponema sp.]